MAKYVVLLNWTEQGIKSVKDSPKRLDAGRERAKKMGCSIDDVYLTIGPYDMVLMLEAPDDETAAKYMLGLGSAGNVRTTTLKALPEDAYRKVIGSL